MTSIFNFPKSKTTKVKEADPSGDQKATTTPTVAKSSEPQTMSHIEIAKIADARPDNVKVTIERLINQGVISHPALQDGIRAANGVIPKVFMLIKRDSYVVMAQINPAFTGALVDRWLKLEQGIKLQASKELLSMDIALSLHTQMGVALHGVKDLQEKVVKIEEEAQGRNKELRDQTKKAFDETQERLEKIEGSHLSTLPPGFSTVDQIRMGSAGTLSYPKAREILERASVASKQYQHVHAHGCQTCTIYHRKAGRAALDQVVLNATKISSLYYTEPTVSGRFQIN